MVNSILNFRAISTKLGLKPTSLQRSRISNKRRTQIALLVHKEACEIAGNNLLDEVMEAIANVYRK